MHRYFQIEIPRHARYSQNPNIRPPKHYTTQGIWSAEVLYNTRYLIPPNMLQAGAPRKWTPHSIIAHFRAVVNRQIAQTLYPKIVHFDIVQND